MKIIPILLNPTIDQIYEIENFEIGGTFKVKSSITYPVGKAISFALGIRELNDNPDILHVVACIGKNEIPLYSRFLKERNIKFEFIPIEGTTRSNKTINDPIQGTTTHVRERGFNLSSKEFNNLELSLKKITSEGDICVFSGSLPPNLGSFVYRDLIILTKSLEAITVIDSSGPPLIQALDAYPAIIKPNLVELSQILGDASINKAFLKQPNSLKIISEKARKLIALDLSIILVTLGAEGALCITKDQILYGNIELKDVIDTVGSGDSFLAGFMLNYYLKKELLDCFRLAIATGAANTLVSGPGIFKKEDLNKIISKVEIQEIN
ncbi:MAG: 1-phosphofructokinase family hexose kinase [Promethearchaeota archaeon]